MVQDDLVFDNRIYRPNASFGFARNRFDIARIRRFRNKRLPHPFRTLLKSRWRVRRRQTPSHTF